MMAAKFGGKIVIIFGVIIASLFTVLVPILAEIGQAKCLYF